MRELGGDAKWCDTRTQPFIVNINIAIIANIAVATRPTADFITNLLRNSKFRQDMISEKIHRSKM